MVKIDGFQEVRQRVDLNSESIVNIILDFEEERVVKAPTDFSGESIEVVDIADLSKTYPPAIIEKLRLANKEMQKSELREGSPAPGRDCSRGAGLLSSPQTSWRDLSENGSLPRCGIRIPDSR